MRAASDIAAEYGVLIRPGGMSDSDVALGLYANVKRLRASRIMEMATAISASISENGHKVMFSLAEDAGVSPREVTRSRMDSWKSQVKRDIASRHTGA